MANLSTYEPSRKPGMVQFMRRTSTLAGLFAPMFVMVVQASAASLILYSSYGPGDTYGVSAAPIGFANQGQANYFIPADTVELESIEVTLALAYDGTAAPITFRLQADNAGLPGTVIETYTVTPTDLFNSTFRPPQTLNSLSHPLLLANATYWVTATMTSGSAFWFISPTGVGHTVDIVSHDNGATWGPSGFGQRWPPVLRVNATSLSPGGVEGIIGAVQDLLENGALAQDTAQGLTDKLEAALGSLNQGNTRAACNQLRGFINQVKALVRASTLTAAQGQALIGLAETVKSENGCS